LEQFQVGVSSAEKTLPNKTQSKSKERKAFADPTFIKIELFVRLKNFVSMFKNIRAKKG